MKSIPFSDRLFGQSIRIKRPTSGSSIRPNWSATECVCCRKANRRWVCRVMGSTRIWTGNTSCLFGAMVSRARTLFAWNCRNKGTLLHRSVERSFQLWNIWIQLFAIIFFPSDFQSNIWTKIMCTRFKCFHYQTLTIKLEAMSLRYSFRHIVESELLPSVPLADYCWF